MTYIHDNPYHQNRMFEIVYIDETWGILWGSNYVRARNQIVFLSLSFISNAIFLNGSLCTDKIRLNFL